MGDLLEQVPATLREATMGNSRHPVAPHSEGGKTQESVGTHEPAHQRGGFRAAHPSSHQNRPGDFANDPQNPLMYGSQAKTLAAASAAGTTPGIPAAANLAGTGGKVAGAPSGQSSGGNAISKQMSGK